MGAAGRASVLGHRPPTDHAAPRELLTAAGSGSPGITTSVSGGEAGATVIRITGPLEEELPRTRRCTALARRLVEQHHGQALDREKLEDLMLVVSELVDNAYVHGKGRIRLKLEERGDRVRVEVMDEGENAAIKIRRLGVRGGGHGLRLVDHLCVGWGAGEGSSHVWAELNSRVSD